MGECGRDGMAVVGRPTLDPSTALRVSGPRYQGYTRVCPYGARDRGKETSRTPLRDWIDSGLGVGWWEGWGSESW